MFPGPVFHAELVRTARRSRIYAIRALYGLGILVEIQWSYATWGRWSAPGGPMLIQDQAEFGRLIFATFLIVQSLVALAMTPALVAGAIAEERRRKTLHYLMASRLGGFEIVAGKLAARLVHVSVLLAVGLPAVGLIGLLGGVDFELLLASTAATATTVYALACGSILISSLARRPREAIALAYGIEVLWLVGPGLVVDWLARAPTPGRAADGWLGPPLRWAATSSPGPVLWQAINGWGGASLTRPLLEMAAFQLGLGTILAVAAAAWLRPGFRRESGRSLLDRALDLLAGPRRWFARPPVGSRPMLWKERYGSRAGGVVRLARNVGMVVLTGYLLAWGYECFLHAGHEAGQDGFYAGGRERGNFLTFLQLTTAGLFALGGLLMAGSAAGSISGEREGDTWISLTATLLDGPEVILGKIAGTIWGCRSFAAILAILLALGGWVGALSPWAAFWVAIELGVFGWFIAALGVTISLRARSTTRAMGATIGTLLFLNGGYLIPLIPFEPGSPVLFAGIMPNTLALSLQGYQLTLHHQYRSGEVLIGMILGVIGYGLAALVLTRYAVSQYDEAAGRPSPRDKVRPPVPMPAPGPAELNFHASLAVSGPKSAR